MSITIVNPQKEQTIEVDGSKINYRIPPPSVILDCFFEIFGKDFDLAKLVDPNFLTQSDQIRLADVVAKQCITGWENVKTKEGEDIAYEIETISYLPFNAKMEIFSKEMSFLAQNLGGGKKSKPSRSKKKT